LDCLQCFAFSALTLLVGRQEGFISSCSVRTPDNNNDDDHDDNNNVQLLTYLVSVDKKDESHVQMKMKKMLRTLALKCTGIREEQYCVLLKPQLYSSVQ